jgi:integral membrane protein (TIGR01906 family)
MIKNRLLSILLAIATVILTITFSIGLPIYVRGFYYAHIDSLELVRRTGHTEEEIRDAYDEVLDYLTLPGREFGTGVFKYSEEGRSHFEDCRGLFTLNATALLLSLATVITLTVLAKKKLFSVSRPFGCSLLLTCGASTLSFFALLALLISLDFDTAFVIFHQLFFPGKDNWVFNARTDEIIRALPQTFFMNCAILILAVLLIGCLILILWDLLPRRRKAPAAPMRMP